MSTRGVNIYKAGPLTLSVCAPKSLTREEVEHDINLQNLAGTTIGWHMSTDPTFAGGEPIPHECEENDDKQHWLLNC